MLDCILVTDIAPFLSSWNWSLVEGLSEWTAAISFKSYQIGGVWDMLKSKTASNIIIPYGVILINNKTN